MSLYGINAYTSSSYYSNLLKASKNSSLVNSMLGSNNKNSSTLSSMLNTSNKNTKTDLSSMLSDALKTDSNDLYTLAKKADLVRSRDYQKELTEAFREYFYGKSDDSTTTNTDTENAEGTETEAAESISAVSLADSTKSLSTAAAKLAAGGTVYSDSEQRLSVMKDYVDGYNNTLDALANSENTKALQKGTSLVNTTNAYSRTLKRIGVTVGSDNRLTLDEDKLKEASDTTLKSLFSGNYSLATKVANTANNINRTANLENQLTYNAKGTATDLTNLLSAYSMFSSTV